MKDFKLAKPPKIKLGLKETDKALIINAPVGYLELIEYSRPILDCDDGRGEYDFIQIFVRGEEELRETFPKYKSKLRKDGMMWVCWPKQFKTKFPPSPRLRRASKFKTQLNENVTREMGLENGMVDVKVVSVNEEWSGLKFVFRLVDRIS